MSQNATVLAALKNHPITALEALHGHKIMRLASRIKDLKYMGHDIDKNMIHKNGKCYASYYLIGEK